MKVSSGHQQSEQVSLPPRTSDHFDPNNSSAHVVIFGIVADLHPIFADTSCIAQYLFRGVTAKGCFREATFGPGTTGISANPP
jgi:hypothetical protein